LVLYFVVKLINGGAIDLNRNISKQLFRLLFNDYSLCSAVVFYKAIYNLLEIVDLAFFIHDINGKANHVGLGVNKGYLGFGGDEVIIYAVGVLVEGEFISSVFK
jgi:hypothetical protein